MTIKVPGEYNRAKYLEYLASDEWKKRRQRAIKRDGGKCRCCGSTTRLTVHHLHYDNLYCERTRDLVTLCWECHQDIHRKETHDWIMKKIDPDNRIRARLGWRMNPKVRKKATPRKPTSPTTK